MSNERETAQAIDEAAAAWAARIDSGRLDADARSELDSWLAADARRQGALIRLQAVSHLLSTATAVVDESAYHDREKVLRLHPPFEPAAARASPGMPARTSRRGLLAGAAMVAGGIAITTLLRTSQSDREIRTGVGEIRRVPLKDGSLAAVNTDTKIAMEFHDKARDVHLEYGEAWFEVVKDPARPFTVAAGEIRVRAVGTAFSVQRLDAGANVQVTEGTVEVWSVGNEANRKRVTAGARIFATNAEGPAEPEDSALTIDRALSWREGNLELDGESLADAAGQFNRYNTVKLEIDPELRDQRVVGRFRTNEPDAFAQAAEAMFSGHVTRHGDVIILSRN